jgi:hypothetical protein
MVAAKQVENFNKLTDETVAILLRSNKARDGTAAFFLAPRTLPGAMPSARAKQPAACHKLIAVRFSSYV